MKYIKYSVFVVIVAIVLWFYRLIRLSNRLQVFNTVEVHSIDRDGVNINVNSLIKNPTNTRLTITRPFITIFLPGNDKPLTSSELVRTDNITFDPDSQQVIGTRIPIDFDVLGQASKIIKAKKVIIEVTARFGINKMFRFTTKEEVEIS